MYMIAYDIWMKGIVSAEINAVELYGHMLHPCILFFVISKKGVFFKHLILILVFFKNILSISRYDF